MKKIDIGKNAKVVVRWDTSQLMTTEEDVKNIIAMMAKKYEINPKNIKVEKNFVGALGKDGSLAGDIVNNIYDPKFMQELMKQWIELRVKDEEKKEIDFEEIVKIDTQINSLIDFDVYNHGKYYTIKWMRWSNFLSYGPDNYFDFTKLKGLILLTGEPGNKSGKSTFAYDLIHFLLFGKINPDKAKTLGQLFNNYLPNERTLSVEGCVDIDGADYIIRRTLTRPAAGKKSKTVTNKVEYFKLLEDGTEELLPEENQQGASTTQTSKIIKEALGNETDFDLIISANAKDLDDIITKTETEKSRLLSRWIGLSVIEDKDAKAREKWNKDISVGRYCDMYSQAQLEEEIEAAEKDNKELSEAIKEEKKGIAECEKRIEEQKKVRDTLLSSKAAIDESMLKVDVVTLKTAMANIVEQGKIRRAQVAKEEENLKNVGKTTYSEEEYKKLREESKDLIEKMAIAREKIKHLKEENDSLANAEYCPTCHRKFDNVDNSKFIEKNKKEINELTEEGVKMKKRNDEVTSKIAEIDECRTNAYKKSQIELKIATINSDIKSLLQEHEEKKKLVLEINKNKEAIENNSKLDAQINVCDANIKTAETLIKQHNEMIVTSEREIGKNNEVISKDKGYLVKIAEERKTEKYWKLYLQMIGKDGIMKMVLRNTLPIMNNELDRLLSDVTDFKVEVVMDDKNDIDFILVRDGVITRLSGASGLEKTQAALALRVVLGKMSNLSKCPFIVLDEVLGTVHKENYDDMKKLYDKIVKEYEFVLHICHIDLDWYDGNVVVQKVDNISRVKQF